MTDWNKQKVPDLKAELKKRGLPQNGLKAELVARLTTADNEAGFESETTIKGDSTEAVHDSGTQNDGSVTGNLTLSEAQLEPEPTTQSQTSQSHDSGALEAVQRKSAEIGNLSNNTQMPSKLSSSMDVDDSKPLETEADSLSSLPSVEPQEVFEDKQKRKRRSQSPPLSTSDSRRKRARANEDLSQTAQSSNHSKDVETTTVDAQWVNKHNGVDSDMIDAGTAVASPSKPHEQPSSAVIDSVSEDMTAEAAKINSKSNLAHTRYDREPIPTSHPNTSPQADLSTSKNKDSRFKDLFVAQHGTLTNSSENIDAEPTERNVAPSIHPATSALYIRDFMRPLNPAALKEHLTILATAQGVILDPDTIVDFYIDPFRTHAFISFQNISAASRVRSELHDQIWPEERTRKPLWADFIPPEKVQEWIAEEQSSSTGARSAGKKWEVTYNVDLEGNVRPVLQEVGSFMAPGRKPSVMPAPLVAPAHMGIEGAPSGPRAQQANGQHAESGRSTLDLLFKYTAAKPVLYYQPVPKELAEKRMDHIEDATSKYYSSRTAGPEINRYTFEDADVLVDRGPEIFSGIRPPPGYRGRGGGGRGGGGYRGRGGDRYEGRGRDERDSRDRRY